MAAGPSTLPPPPGAGGPAGPGPGDVNPTSPAAASPSPPTPSPTMQHGTAMAISVIQGLRAIAKSFPATAPDIAEINNKMREVMSKMMASQEPGEPAAPPTGG